MSKKWSQIKMSSLRTSNILDCIKEINKQKNFLETISVRHFY